MSVLCTLRVGLNRPQHRLRLLAPCRTVQARRKQSTHSPRQLPYPIEGGLGEFLSPAGLRNLAVDYQQGLLSRLNEEIRDKDHLVNKSVADVVMQTAPDMENTLAFNYASLALNNSFFLDCLRPPEPGYLNHEHKMTKYMNGRINGAYTSMANFKSYFSAAAEGLFAGGFTWLVVDSNGNLAVLNTHGAGSFLVASRRVQLPDFRKGPSLGEMVPDRKQPKGYSPYPDAPSATPSPAYSTHTLESIPPTTTEPSHTPDGPTTTSPASGVSYPSSPFSPPPNTRAFHSTPRPRIWDSQTPTSIWDGTTSTASEPALNPYTSSPYTSSGAQKNNEHKMGENLGPLFCISAYEHAWMGAGYGVWGKREYLRRFWSVLDWDKVSSTYELWVRSSGKASYLA